MHVKEDLDKLTLDWTVEDNPDSPLSGKHILMAEDMIINAEMLKHKSNPQSGPFRREVHTDHRPYCERRRSGHSKILGRWHECPPF